MWLLLLHLVQADSLSIPATTGQVRFDGVPSEAEYGAPAVLLPLAAGTVPIWLRRDSAWVYIAASIPDSTFYWGDDFVVSLDPQGDRAPSPQADDVQWYFRRVLDSSVVFRGEAGTWHPPKDDSDWRLGAERDGIGWAVRAVSCTTGWSLELRVDVAYFEERRGRLPGIAFRIFDDAPQGWFPWPAHAGVKHPTEIERRPMLWAAVSQ
jgi:hypothetical protein